MLGDHRERTRFTQRQGFPQTRPRSDAGEGQTVGTVGKWGGSDTGTRHRQDSGSGEQNPRRGAWVPMRGEEDRKAARHAEGAGDRPHQACSSRAESPRASPWPSNEENDARSLNLLLPLASSGLRAPSSTCTHTGLPFPAGFPGGDLCNDLCPLGLPNRWGGLGAGSLPAALTSARAARHSGEAGPGPGDREEWARGRPGL